MNGFRVTLLILLALAVVALLGIVTVFQNSQEANYEAYLASVKASERQQLLAAHNDRMKRIGPQEETGPGADALKAAREEQEKRVTAEEERNVLASAVRKDAAQAEQKAAEEAAAAEKAAAEEVAEDNPLGLVSSYNQDWGFIMIKPVSNDPMPAGMVVAVRREDKIICEAEIASEETDGQTGERLISATIRESHFTRGSQQISADKFTPAVGDEIIITPYMSSRDLRIGDPSGMSPAPFAPAETGAAPEPEGLPEVPATLIPMP